MRLIDADTSIESIRNLIGNGATLEQAVDAQPTAYDVDKVMKQLKQNGQKMSRVLPILFNTDMVRAILDGRKTVTRRCIKPRYKADEGGFQICTNKGTGERWVEKTDWDEGSFDDPRYVNPPYQPGDILYVRETWKKAPNGYYYYENWQKDDIADVTKWKPSIHMPKEAARIWLKVMDVRVERLSDMKPVDVIKEGAYPECWNCINTYGTSGSQCCYGTGDECSQCDGVMMEWEKIWNSTIKKSNIDRYGWNANPWVWVIEFERCEKPEEVRNE